MKSLGSCEKFRETSLWNQILHPVFINTKVNKLITTKIVYTSKI